LKNEILSLEVGQERIFYTHEAKPISVRMAVSHLRKDGYNLIVTERGMRDAIKVIRKK
jgi:hypothetical protein